MKAKSVPVEGVPNVPLALFASAKLTWVVGVQAEFPAQNKKLAVKGSPVPKGACPPSKSVAMPVKSYRSREMETEYPCIFDLVISITRIEAHSPKSRLIIAPHVGRAASGSGRDRHRSAS